jgi:4-carboxymuconolactone decarboxylase
MTTSPTTPRLAPVPPESTTAELADLYDRGGLRAPDGGTLNIFATLGHHPKALKRWLVFAGHVLAKNTLTPRDRELLILRTGWRCRSRYEWCQHVVIGLACGLSADEIERVKLGASDAWTAHDRALLTAADELHDESRLSDATWAALAAVYSNEQMLDVMFTVGNYHLVAFMLNSCGVELDEGVPDEPALH